MSAPFQLDEAADFVEVPYDYTDAQESVSQKQMAQFLFDKRSRYYTPYLQFGGLEVVDPNAIIGAAQTVVGAGTALLAQKEATKQAKAQAKAAKAQARAAAAAAAGRSTLPFGLTPITATIAAVGGIALVGVLVYALTPRTKKET